MKYWRSTVPGSSARRNPADRRRSGDAILAAGSLEGERTPEDVVLVLNRLDRDDQRAAAVRVDLALKLETGTRELRKESLPLTG